LPVSCLSELEDLQSNAIKGVVYGLLITKHSSSSTCSSSVRRIDRPDEHVVLIVFAAVIITLSGIVENSRRAKCICLVGDKEYGLKREETTQKIGRVFYKAPGV
jgi:hypothetical protein